MEGEKVMVGPRVTGSVELPSRLPGRHGEMTQRSHLTARQDSERENKILREECEITSDGSANKKKKKKGGKEKIPTCFQLAVTAFGCSCVNLFTIPQRNHLLIRC